MYIATMKTMTLAMKARTVLLARGIDCETVSLDPSLTTRGCAWGIRFPSSAREEARRALEALLLAVIEEKTINEKAALLKYINRQQIGG